MGEFNRGDRVKPSQYALDRHIVKSDRLCGDVVGFSRFLTLDGRQVVRVRWDGKTQIHGYHPDFIELLATDQAQRVTAG